MRKHADIDPQDTRKYTRLTVDASEADERPPRRLLTAFDVAELVGCHEESVRRAYLCGQLQRQRFGVRSWRFHLAGVEDWVRRGAPTRVS